jgi:hypothetical protein
LPSKAVIHPSELWPIRLLGVWSFLAGLSVYLWGMIVVAMVVSGWQPRPRMFFGTLIAGVGIPWLFLWRYQWNIRTRTRAVLSGGACGFGAVSLMVVFSIGNPDSEQWFTVGTATVALVLFYALSNLVLLIIFNRLRSPPPIQDGTLCPGCGYCLVGNISMICSECGRPFSWEELALTESRSPASRPGSGRGGS